MCVCACVRVCVCVCACVCVYIIMLVYMCVYMFMFVCMCMTCAAKNKAAVNIYTCSLAVYAHGGPAIECSFDSQYVCSKEGNLFPTWN